VSIPTLTEYTQPEAPKQHPKERYCEGEGCITRVNRYQKRINSETQGPQGPLLCFSCAKKWVDGKLEAAIAKEERRREKQQVMMLPGLKAARLAARWGPNKDNPVSQKMLARAVGTNDTVLGHIERERYGATYTMAHNLARSLGVSVNELRGRA
jgi:DNA-binding XRE family transcriptional regulator